MKLTLQLIQNELLSLDARLNTINLYPNRWLSQREQLLKDTLQRRDDLLFERDQIIEQFIQQRTMKQIEKLLEFESEKERNEFINNKKPLK